jgi:hypothetical protein
VIGFTNGVVNIATVTYQVLDSSGESVVTQQLDVAAKDVSSTDMASLLSLHTQVKTAAQNAQGL